MTDKLLPCPFCPDGGRPYIDDSSFNEVECGACGTQTFTCAGKTGVERWQSRPPAIAWQSIPRDEPENFHDKDVEIWVWCIDKPLRLNRLDYIVGDLCWVFADSRANAGKRNISWNMLYTNQQFTHYTTHIPSPNG